VGEPQDAKTQTLKVGVPGAVALEGGAVAVVAEAVGLDDQASFAPEEVHLVGADARVHLWLGKAVTVTEGDEETLQLAAGQVGLALEIARADQAEVESAADGALVGL
jgi:GAF domain-containing protein